MCSPSLNNENVAAAAAAVSFADYENIFCSAWKRDEQRLAELQLLLLCDPQSVQTVCEVVTERTPLALACAECDSVPCVRQLMAQFDSAGKATAAALAPDATGISPIAAACRAGHLGVLEFLLDRVSIASVGARVPPGLLSSLLWDAASANQVAVMKVLLQRGAPLDGYCGGAEEEEEEEESPLVAACDTFSVEAVEFLVDRGARLDVCDSETGLALLPLVLSIPAQTMAEHLAQNRIVQLLTNRPLSLVHLTLRLINRHRAHFEPVIELSLPEELRRRIAARC